MLPGQCNAWVEATLVANGTPIVEWLAPSPSSWQECDPFKVSGGFTQVISTATGVTAIAKPAIVIESPRGCRYALASVSSNWQMDGFVGTAVEDAHNPLCTGVMPISAFVDPFGPDPSSGSLAVHPTRVRVSPPLATVERYWRDIGKHQFARAYHLLAPDTIAASQSQFVASEKQAHIRHVEFFGKQAHNREHDSGRGVAVVPVFGLVTEDVKSGCQIWRGAYHLKHQATGWRIRRAAIAPRRCTETNTRPNGLRRQDSG